MKKILAVAVVVLLSTSGAAFAGSYGAAGCGLGSLVFGDQKGPVQILAAATNGTFGSQTFGITTGTSNCPAGIISVSDARMNEFVVANMDNLAKDIARGSGETLEAFADLLQVPTDKRAEFNQKLQTNFARIFTSENVVLAQVVDNAITVSAN